MTFSYSLALTDNKDKVRNLINDTDSASFQVEDEEIKSFLSSTSQDIFLSAAFCLRKIASSQALLAKRKKAGNYEEDLRDIAKNLLAVADTYENQSKSCPSEADSLEVLTDFNYREIERNKALRDETES